jgi:hypothetical protein
MADFAMRKYLPASFTSRYPTDIDVIVAPIIDRFYLFLERVCQPWTS